MEDIYRKISRHIPGVIGDRDRHRSAVCIPLIRNGEEVEILFEIRSGKILTQPGDICLPGGGMEQGETPEETAVRETCEELKIGPDKIRMIGPIDVFREGNVIIYPFAAYLEDYRGSFSEDEVSGTFRVPLSFFMDTEPEVYRTSYRPVFSDDFPFDRIYGGRNYRWRQVEKATLFYQYGQYTIWGFTARVIRAFTEILREETGPADSMEERDTDRK